MSLAPISPSPAGCERRFIGGLELCARSRSPRPECAGDFAASARRSPVPPADQNPADPGPDGHPAPRDGHPAIRHSVGKNRDKTTLTRSTKKLRG
jgi:hypothetical protein